MGWFWADSSTSASKPRAPHPPPKADATPPVRPPDPVVNTDTDSSQPSCPMHKSSSDATSPPLQNQTAPPPSSCPVQHSSSSSSSTTLSKLNPLNLMPTLSSAPSPHQKTPLPTTRTTSSIPRGDSSDQNWEYPSPQQMYNAILRKGYDGTPEDGVESMVAIHNWLNEGAWEEIKAWEGRFAKGLREGWRNCAKGEEGWERLVGERERLGEGEEPRLMRFMGRPGTVSPKARLQGLAAWVWPNKFEATPPFDRHDWFIQRTLPSGTKSEIRYVIDYYSGPSEANGDPVFFLDVRPAVDSPTAACERMMRWGGDVWWKASGGMVREQQREKEKQGGT